ncbi:MAG: dehydrogenase [Planctomyces sp.]|nr:dehydrogenase [Planctomyces sp.]
MRNPNVPPAANHSSRREFLKQTGAIGAALYVGSKSVLAQEAERSANNEIRFACVGVEGKGSSDRDDAGRHGKIVALCDVDTDRLEKAAARYPQAKKYTDFRKMFDEMSKDIDAVTVSTPDHTHAVSAVRALREGKHVFCQKPLTYTIEEARLLHQLATEKKLCTQMGNQGTATGGLREAVQIIRKGDLGAVKEVHIWTNRPIWPQGLGRPTAVETAPKTLDWDLWLGPAPERPYNSAYAPFKWRGWLDFGTGALGDMACHTMNMSVMALDLFDPVSVVAESSGIIENESYPKNSKITYKFKANDKRGPVTLYWYDGGNRPDPALMPGVKQGASGSLVIGEKGSIFSDNDYHGTYTLLPSEQWKEYVKPEYKVSPGHFKEFADAIKENKPELAMSNFDYACRLTETVLLGNVALRAGKEIEWDGVNMKVTNLPEANKFLTREYRKGWELV